MMYMSIVFFFFFFFFFTVEFYSLFSHIYCVSTCLSDRDAVGKPIILGRPDPVTAKYSNNLENTSNALLMDWKAPGGPDIPREF
ncbi:hypothetical protein ACN38_g2443 [Penicillium nordicum]|uniref:Uncharacterized protein n=1 Tax=Penicillium nordicum TaxID=229535 RepID=A0A0M9WIU9_9EURO|nr:hypothetical protein ACN38_g2443 [Penicillium nordicum]